MKIKVIKENKITDNKLLESFAEDYSKKGNFRKSRILEEKEYELKKRKKVNKKYDDKIDYLNESMGKFNKKNDIIKQENEDRRKKLLKKMNS